MALALFACGLSLLLGFLFKAQCLDGRFGERAYERLCYNDIQPLHGLRLFREDETGSRERVFPYLHGSLRGDTLEDGAIEYPVLTGLFMYGTSFFAGEADPYLVVSALFLAPFGLLTAYLLGLLADERALLWAAAPALVLYAFHNWDLLVVAAAVVGIWCWSRDRPMWAAVAFGVGASFKMWPVFLLAPLCLFVLRHLGFKRAVVCGVAGVGTAVAINLPFALANFDGWWATYAFHRQRGPNFDSIWQVTWPEWTPGHVNLVSGGLTAAFFVSILAFSWWRARRDGTYPFVATGGALVATFLLFNKVHSPQFTLWLLPFFVLLRVHVLWWMGYAAADLAVYVGIFRWFHEWGLGIQEGPALRLMEVGVRARALLLVLLVFVFALARDTTDPDVASEEEGQGSVLPGEPVAEAR